MSSINKYVRMLPFFKSEDNLLKYQNSKVMIVGLGGVGGLVTEIIARTGIRELTLIDGDSVEESNFNRQIIAFDSNIGMNKCQAFAKRIYDIDNTIKVNVYPYFIDENNIPSLDIASYDLVLDCIDDVKAKIALIKECKKENVKIISSMGTGNKYNPMRFKIADIEKTSYCPLAKKIRVALRKEGIKDVEVCYSDEAPSVKQDFIASLMYCVDGASLVIAKRAIEYLKSLKNLE